MSSSNGRPHYMPAIAMPQSDKASAWLPHCPARFCVLDGSRHCPTVAEVRGRCVGHEAASTTPAAIRSEVKIFLLENARRVR